MIRFGTDGVRGVAFEQLTLDYVARLGRVAGRRLGSTRVIIGQDTRESGTQLAEALAGGLRASGCEVEFLGVMPTPAIAFLAQADGCAAAAITASHNPYRDNGVKLFSVGGNKLTDEVQDAIEGDLSGGASSPADQPVALERTDRSAQYVEHVASVIAPRDLTGVTVVLDCANGAMSEVAPRAFAALGATVIAINDDPNGRNINEGCGAAHPEALSEAVRLHSADLGLAFDGDADRVFVVDETGTGLSGSTTTALLAAAVLRTNPGATIIHNLICSRTVAEVIAEGGGKAVRSKVGHSYIKQLMAETGAVFGGEHSAHYYFLDNYRADSGLIAAMFVLAELSRSGVPLSEVRRPFDRYAASGEINTQVDDPKAVIERVAAAFPGRPQDRLDGLTVDCGPWWFNLRASNTEPLLRLNLEAPTRAECDDHVVELLALITAG